MALPVGAPVTHCTLSRPLQADGTVGTIVSAFLSIDRSIIYVPTGETIFDDEVSIAPVPIGTSQGSLAFDVIPVDAPNVRDAAGNTVIAWEYKLRVTNQLDNDLTEVVDYFFQPQMVQLNFDIDLVPQVGVVSVPPVTAPPIYSPDIVDGGAP